MLNWGGKNWRPGAPSNRKQPINQSIEELMKPLGEKTFQGNVWGSVIMNVPEPDVTPTPTPSITPTNTQTPTTTLTPTPTTTLTPTPSFTPSPTPVPYVRFVAHGVSDVAQAESPTYYSLDGSVWSASTTTSRNLSTFLTPVQYDSVQSLWTTAGDGQLTNYVQSSTDGITFVDGVSAYAIKSIARGTTNWNIGQGYGLLSVPTVPTQVGLDSSDYGTVFNCGSGANDLIYCNFPTGEIWIAGGNGCSAGGLGYILGESPDTVGWTSNTGATDYIGTPNAFASNYNSSTNDETKVVMVGGAGSLGNSLAAVSEDGITWSGETTNLTIPFIILNDIIWDGSKFLACGTPNPLLNESLFATSTDGFTWVVNTSATTGSLGVASVDTIAYDGNTYVAISNTFFGSQLAFLNSTDGITWTTNVPTLPAGVTLYNIDSNPHPYRR